MDVESAHDRFHMACGGDMAGFVPTGYVPMFFLVRPVLSLFTPISDVCRQLVLLCLCVLLAPLQRRSYVPIVPQGLAEHYSLSRTL